MNHKFKSIVITAKTKKPQAVIFVFHGYGANATDLQSLAQYFYQKFDDITYFITQAPQVCELGSGYQWFPLQNASILDYQERIDKIAPQIDEYIKDILQQIKPENQQYGMIGFSQGAMLALYLALNYITKPKLVIAYSGLLIENQNAINQNNNNTKFLLVHGKLDSVIPVHAIDETAKWMQKHKINYQIHKINQLAHGIDQKALDYGTQFFADNFS